MADSLNIEFDFEDVLKNNIRMVGELGRKFERYKWLKRNLNDLWERIERVDEYNITNKKKLFGFLLSILRRYGNCVISREDLPSYMKSNESNLPEVFASYAYDDKNWIYFVESVTSVSPMDPKRILEITEMTKDVTAGKIFITAFLDFKTYKKFAEELAWETEVWIAEMPEHMIHLNGDRFMGPR